MHRLFHSFGVNLVGCVMRAPHRSSARVLCASAAAAVITSASNHNSSSHQSYESSTSTSSSTTSSSPSSSSSASPSSPLPSDAECPWCQYMSAGPCGTLFNQWRQCVKLSKEKEVDEILAHTPSLSRDDAADQSKRYVGECRAAFKSMQQCQEIPQNKPYYAFLYENENSDDNSTPDVGDSDDDGFDVGEQALELENRVEDFD